MIRVELCPRNFGIGCGFVVALSLGFIAYALVLFPWMLILFVGYIPLPLIYFSQIKSLRKFAGKVLEVDEHRLVLFDRSFPEWELRWSEIRLVRLKRIGWDLEDRDGNSHAVAMFNVSSVTREAIRALIPRDVPVEIQEEEYLKGMPLALGAGIGIIGACLTIWGGLGIFLLEVMLRGVASEDSLAIDLNLLRWKFLALFSGIVLTMIGGSRVFRNEQRIAVNSIAVLSLKDHLSAESLNPTEGPPLNWRAKPTKTSTRKAMGLFLMFACTFWGALYIVVIREAIRNPRDMFLVWMYTLIIAFHAYGVYSWTKRLDPRTWTIKTQGPAIWVEGERAEYSATFKRVKSDYSISFSLDGRKRELYASDFVLASDLPNPTTNQSRPFGKAI